jgi:RimJ/RimL family protein N-acetyltransferase
LTHSRHCFRDAREYYRSGFDFHSTASFCASAICAGVICCATRFRLLIASWSLRAAAKLRHKAMIWGMYVRHEARQYGIGERLIDAAVAHASSDVEQLHLAVVTENEAARRIYAKAGFIEYGHQINALKHGGRYYDDILMVKFLGA